MDIQLDTDPPCVYHKGVKNISDPGDPESIFQTQSSFYCIAGSVEFAKKHYASYKKLCDSLDAAMGRILAQQCASVVANVTAGLFDSVFGQSALSMMDSENGNHQSAHSIQSACGVSGSNQPMSAGDSAFCEYSGKNDAFLEQLEMELFPDHKLDFVTSVSVYCGCDYGLQKRILDLVEQNLAQRSIIPNTLAIPKENGFVKIPSEKFVVIRINPSGSNKLGSLISELVTGIWEKLTKYFDDCMASSKHCVSKKTSSPKKLREVRNKKIKGGSSDENSKSSASDSIKPNHLTGFTPITFAGLFDAFQNLVLSNNEGSQISYPRLILIFESVELFNSRNLGEVIQCLIGYRIKLPMSFLFSISSTHGGLHRYLPVSVMSRLRLRTFDLPPVVNLFEGLCEHVLMNPTGSNPGVEHFSLDEFRFRPTQKTLNVVADVFLCHNMSVDYVIKAFKLSLLHHFRDNPASALYPYLAIAEWNIHDSPGGSLPPNKLLVRILQNIPSAGDLIGEASRSHHNSSSTLPSSPKKKKLPNVIAAKLESVVLGALDDLVVYQNHFVVGCRLLQMLYRIIPVAPWGRQIISIYSAILSKRNCFGTSAYAEVLKCIEGLGRIDILEYLRSALEIVVKERGMEKYACNIERFIDNFENVKQRQAELEHERNKAAEDRDAADAESLRKLGKQKLSLAGLKNRLRDAVAQKRDYFQLERERLVKFMDETFLSLLRKPHDLPLHEVLYYTPAFSGGQSLEALLVAHPKLTIEQALNGHLNYVSNSALLMRRESGDNKVSNGGEIAESPGAPPICSLYEVLSEQGKSFEISQWYAGFVENLRLRNPENFQVQNNVKNGPKKHNDASSSPNSTSAKHQRSRKRCSTPEDIASGTALSKTSDNLLNKRKAEFLLGVTEFEYLGFIRRPPYDGNKVQKLDSCVMHS